jgi:drug/metabolite transporter (DMT)-like permease
VVGLLVGFTGVAVLVFPQLRGSGSAGFEGPVLVVGAVIGFALGSVFLRKTAKIEPSFWTLSLQFGAAGVLVGTIALLSGEPLSLGNGTTVVPALAYLVVVAGIVGYSLYFRIHHTSGPTLANLVGYVNPAAGVLVGLIVFGETVTTIEIGGLILIAGGLFLLQRDRRIGLAPRPVDRGSSAPGPVVEVSGEKLRDE